MKKLIDFNKFERARTLLEHSAPFNIDEQLLESNGLTRDELEAVNEGFLKDLFGGWFKKMKTAMLRKIPGGVLSKVDKIVAKYEVEKLDLMKRGLKEKEKMYKAEVGADSDPSNKKKYEQIVDRANQALKAIKTASNAKIDRFNTELEQAADGKSDMVADYINLKIAEVKEKVAMSELKEIEKFATEDQVDKATKEVEDKKKAREDLQKNLEEAIKSAKTLAGADAKKGEKWVRKNNKGEEVTVEVLDDPSKLKDGEIQVKGKDGTEYSAKIESFIKKSNGGSETKTDPAVKKLEDTIDTSIEALTKDDEDKLHRLIGQLMNNMRDAKGNREEEIKYKLQILVTEERLLQKHKDSLGAKITLDGIKKERKELLAELDQIGVDKVMSTKVDKMTLGKKGKKIVGLSKDNPLDLKVEDEE